MAKRSLPGSDYGVFTLSLDFEQIWGTLDLFGPEGFRRACEVERSLIPRLLDLFVEFKVPATWCVLGHLFLGHCPSGLGPKHPEITRPTHSWCRHDWFEHDPGGTEEEEPVFFGRSLVEQIKSCPVTQEIGCHSFAHIIFGDPGCSAAAAESDLAACVRAACQAGVEPRSFAFPRNQIGHLGALRAHGFTCYRGPEPNWYAHRRWPDTLKRLAHLWDVLTAAAPPVVSPELTSEGLWNLPASMMYFPMHGLRRYIPLRLRVRRATKGLDAAARRRRVFHLWFHPTNLADQPEPMFAGLRQILEHARQLRDRGELQFLPMAALASSAAESSSAQAGAT